MKCQRCNKTTGIQNYLGMIMLCDDCVRGHKWKVDQVDRIFCTMENSSINSLVEIIMSYALDKR